MILYKGSWWLVMFFDRLIPDEFRPLLEYISPAAFKVVDWKRAVLDFGQLSRNMLDAEYLGALREDISPLLPIGVELRSDEAKGVAGSMSTKEQGEKVLAIYFAQLFNESGLFLDLRRSCFREERQHLAWGPSPLVHRFSDGFRCGLIQLYMGYYLRDDRALRDGLFALGLADRSDDEAVLQVCGLLFEHFGRDDSHAVRFRLDKFQDSFHELFIYLKKNNVRLSSDFLFLGIYLVTLYMNLSSIDEELDVEAVFSRVWESKPVGESS